MKSDTSNQTVGLAARLAEHLVELRVLLAVVASTILAICVPLSQRLELDRTIDQMFAPDDPTLLAYEELRAAFGGNAAMMLVYRDDELMSPLGLQRAKQISVEVSQVPGVRGVLSPAQLNDLLGYLRPLSPAKLIPSKSSDDQPAGSSLSRCSGQMTW